MPTSIMQAKIRMSPSLLVLLCTLFSKSLGYFGCIKAEDRETCCNHLDYDADLEVSEENSPGCLPCNWPPRKCTSIISYIIRGGSPLVTEKQRGNGEKEIMLQMNVLSVHDLGRDGVLRMSVRINSKIIHDQIRWDEKMKNCDISTKVC